MINSFCFFRSDPKGKYTNCREVLTELGLRNVSDQDCENVRYVCSVVSRRAAHLASAGIATLLNRMGENNVTVGIDGSVYRFHPHFHDLMTNKISQLQQYKVRGIILKRWTLTSQLYFLISYTLLIMFSCSLI